LEEGFMLNYLFPRFKEEIMEKLLLVTSSEDFYRVQGAYRMLKDMENHVRALKKRRARITL
jgi:hypothetical protein